MIDFKSINYITGKRGEIQSGFSKILTFYDLIGHNVLIMYDEDFDSGIRAWSTNCSSKSFKRSSFLDVLTDNLFRLEYLVIDIYHSATMEYMKYLESKVREVVQIPIIFIIKIDPKIDLDPDHKYSLINTLNKRKDSTFYQVSKDPIKSGSVSLQQLISTKEKEDKYFISDLFENWKTSFKELKLSYVRNKKLEEIFKEDSEEN